MKNRYQHLTQFSPFNPLNHTQIWLATDSHCQKNVLLKQLKQGFNALQFEQFYNEYQVYQLIAKLLDLEKNHFANYLDFYKQDGDYFLVLKWYEGKTLKQIIAENQLKFHQKITVLIQLCQAVEIFHSLGFIHCDMKPSNILITKNQVKLLDFGLAKKAGENLNANNFTAGTPAYMSPEQFIGGQICVQSDYYSLGIVIYEFLIGEKPFLADSLEQWVLYHCQTPFPAIKRFNQQQNQIIQAVLNLLLAKCSINRSQNLTQVTSWLKRLQEN